MKKVILGGVFAAILVSTSGAAFACYKQKQRVGANMMFKSRISGAALVTSAFALTIFLTSFSSQSYAGSKKLRRALAIGTAIGIGVAVVDKIIKKKNKRKFKSIAKLPQKSRDKNSTSRTTNIFIQNALNAKGFNAGIADGILGKGSRAAIRNYQQSIAASPTGKLTKHQLNNLIGSTTRVTTVSTNNSKSSSELDALTRKLFSNSSGLHSNLSDFKVFSDGSITFHYNHTRGGKRTGQFDVQTGSVSTLQSSVNFVYGSPGNISITDINEKRDYDLAVGPQSHTPAQAQQWALEKTNIISKMAAIAGRNFNKSAAQNQISSDADSAENGIGQGMRNLKSIAGGIISNSTVPNYTSPRYQIVKDNTNQSSHKHVIIKCRDGTQNNVFLEGDGSWGTGFFDLGKHSFKQVAETLCL